MANYTTLGVTQVSESELENLLYILNLDGQEVLAEVYNVLMCLCLTENDNGETHKTPRLVVEDRDKRERIVATIHDQSHVGVNRTLDMISSKYYWPGLTTDVKEYVSTVILQYEIRMIVT